MEVSEDQQRRKSALVENFGMHLESEGNLSPLAARMLAYLIVDNHKGITFEEMVDFLKASKSSIWTNLKMLMCKGHVTYYTLPGDRKKYFTLAPDDMIDRMDQKIRSCEQKLSLCRQIIDYKKEHIVSDEEGAVSKQVSYLENYIHFIERYRALCHQHKENIIHLRK